MGFFANEMKRSTTRGPSIEIWKPVPGYSRALRASSFGRLKLLARLSPKGRRMKERILLGGRVSIPNSDGSFACAPRAVLILLAFVGPPPIPWGGQTTKIVARHLDDNTSNNKLKNLAWGSRADNLEDARKNGRKPGFQKGAVYPLAGRIKISKTSKGKPHTKEHNAKVAAALKGRKLTPEHCINIAIAARNRKRRSYGIFR